MVQTVGFMSKNPHVPSSVSEALVDDAISSENIATEESIQPIIEEDSESTVRYRPGPKSRKKYLVVKESDPIKESLKRKSESHGEQPSKRQKPDEIETPATEILKENVDASSTCESGSFRSRRS